MRLSKRASIVSSRDSHPGGSMRSRLTLAVVALLASALTAQTPKQSGTVAPEVKTWSVPWKGTTPRDAFIDQKGRVWFCGQRGDYVAYVDSKTGEFKRFAIDSN